MPASLCIVQASFCALSFIHSHTHTNPKPAQTYKENQIDKRFLFYSISVENFLIKSFRL